MGSIVFLSGEILLIGAGIYAASFFTVCMLTLFSLGMLWFWFEKKEILYYVIPLIFLGRVYTGVNFETVNSEKIKDNIFKIETNIINSRGRVLNIDGRFPLENINLYIPNISDGRYIVYGKMEKISDEYSYYSVESIQEEAVQPNIFEKFFNKRLKMIREYLSNRCGNFFQGVILGERRYIYKDIREKFIQSGAAHLLAVSGLHIGAVIGIILYAVNFLKIKRELRYFLALVFLNIYTAGINSSPSVIRASVMGNIFLTGKMIYESVDMKKSLSLAAVINLFIYPNSAGDISFLMSYICLFTIIYIYPKCRILKEIKCRNIVNFLIFTGTIQIFIIPISIYFFGTISFLSYFTNLIITPVGISYITLGFISFFVPEKIFEFIFSYILENIYKILEAMLNFFTKFPYLAIKTNEKISLKFILFIYIILITGIYRKEIQKFFIKNKKSGRIE